MNFMFRFDDVYIVHFSSMRYLTISWKHFCGMWIFHFIELDWTFDRGY